jgi:hypothetical protein
METLKAFLIARIEQCEKAKRSLPPFESRSLGQEMAARNLKGRISELKLVLDCCDHERRMLRMIRVIGTR